MSVNKKQWILTIVFGVMAVVIIATLSIFSLANVMTFSAGALFMLLFGRCMVAIEDREMSRE